MLRGLYLVTPDQADTDALLAAVAAVLPARPALVQYRNKLADAALKREQATRLLALCRAAGVPLVINDDLALALEIGADGAHLGRDDGDPGGARRPSARPHPRRQLLRRMARAVAAPRRVSITWPSARCSLVHQARRAPRRPRPADPRQARARLPVAAIGGITLDNAPPLIAAGADLLAVISDVFSAPDPAARAAAYAGLFD
jgi:thiamine-phosphate pyrophosphorylase